MHCYQFVHTLNYGDAISNEALLIRRLLQEAGFGSEIVAVHAHEKVAGECRLLQTCAEELRTKQLGQAGVLLHYSIASPLNTLFTELPNFYRTVVYHNLTPERWFHGYNARVVNDLRLAREELRIVSRAADRVVSDSEFNRKELSEISGVSGSVLPLALDQKKWAIPSNGGIASILRGHGGKNFLHVGRIAPNKCIEDIIKTFYFYHHKINKESRLWLIGSDIDTEIYSFELRKLVRDLHLESAVIFVGSVADSELKSFYENSDLYLVMSEHEGFCVPLVEAMHFGLPVIAFENSAVGETLGDGGLRLQRKSPAETAELCSLVLRDDAFRQKMIIAGKARADQFSLERFTQALKSHVIDPLIAYRDRHGSAAESAKDGGSSTPTNREKVRATSGT